MELIEPSAIYQESFLELLQELKDHSISGFWNFRNDPSLDITSYIEHTKKEAEGKNLPENFVPATTYWLVDKNEIVGHVQIRHRLTPGLERRGGHIGYAIRPSRQKQGYGSEILRLALSKASNFGIQKVLITCDENNIASRKIIEKNGGKLQDEIEVNGIPILRFWISCEGIKKDS